MYRKDKKYTINEVKEATKDVLFLPRHDKNSKINFDGDIIKGNSQRYQLFFTKGCQCVKCGIKGKYFVKEKHREHDPYHLNLYGINEKGKEVLITKDHIIPKSKGGKNYFDNYQTMCTICNGNKKDNI